MTIPVSKLRRQVSSRHDDARDLDERGGSPSREGLRPLARREIDKCIERITGEVAGGLLANMTVVHEFTAPRPRWVSAKEFADKMRPFLGNN